MRLAMAVFALCSGLGLQAQMQAVRSYPPGLAASSRMGISSRSVAIGNGMIAVGAPYHGTAGAVFVFDEKMGKHLFTLLGSVHTGAELFGWAVDISGTKLIVGAPFTDLLASGNAGAAYVFDLRTRQVVQSIISANFLAGDNWGYSVDLDGEMIALGATYADTHGAVELWRLGNPNRLHRIQTLSPLVANDARFGQALALENGILAVGAPGEYVTYTGNHAGRFFVFDAVANSQLFEGSITGGAGEEFGSALAMNGNLLAVAAPGVTPQNGGPGLVALYSLNNLNGGFGSFGGVGAISSVAIDEGRLAMSAPDSAVRLGNGVNEYLPYPKGALTGDSMGASLAVRGSLVVTTAPGDDSGSSNGGAFWRFSPVAQVEPTDPALATGDSMPSSGNAILSAIGPAVASQFGNPVMIGTLAGGDALGERRFAVWGRQGANGIRLLAQTGLPAAPQARWTSFSQVLTREDNWHWLRGTIAGPGITNANNVAFNHYDVANSSTTRVLQSGTLLGTGAIRSFSGDARANDNNATLAVPVIYSPSAGLVLGTTAADSGIVEVGPAGLVKEWREGVTVAPDGIRRLGQLSSRFGIQDGNFAMTHFLQGAPAASNQIIQWLGTEQARTGTLAQADTGSLSNYTTITGEVGNGAYCVYRANLALSVTAGITTASNEGLFSNRTGNPAKMVLLKNFPVASSDFAPSGAISRFLEFGIASTGDIIALVQLRGAGINGSNDLALILAKAGLGGSTEVLLREGASAPGCHGARIGTILKVDFTGHRNGTLNHYGVIASLVVEPGGASATNNLVLLRGNTRRGTASQLALRRPYLVRRKGHQVVSAGGVQTYTSFELPCVIRDASGALNTGLGHMVDALTGAILVKARLSTGRQELLTIE